MSMSQMMDRQRIQTALQVGLLMAERHPVGASLREVGRRAPEGLQKEAESS